MSPSGKSDRMGKHAIRLGNSPDLQTNAVALARKREFVLARILINDPLGADFLGVSNQIENSRRGIPFDACFVTVLFHRFFEVVEAMKRSLRLNDH